VFVLDVCASAVEGGEDKKAEWSVRRDSRRPRKRSERSDETRKKRRDAARGFYDMWAFMILNRWIVDRSVPMPDAWRGC